MSALRPAAHYTRNTSWHSQSTSNDQFTCNRTPAPPFKKSLKRQLSLRITWPFRPFHGCKVRMRWKSAYSLTDSLSSLLCSYAWICSNTSTLSYASNSYPQIRSIKGNRPPNISWGARSSLLFWSPDDKPSYSYLIVHSDQVIKPRKACVVPLCFTAAFLPMEATPCKTYFLLWHLLKTASCAVLCVILWPKRVDRFVEAAPSISMHQIWILSTSYLHVKYYFPS